MIQIVLQSIFYIGFSFICFALIPVIAWRKTKNKLFVLIQTGIAAMWLTMLISYFTDIPEGESGFVIVGMLFVWPIFCIVTQLIFSGVYWIVNRVFIVR
ncbi:hypothetical protein [Glaciecola sp. 1036]|uniref:hypothetical protein n=1 Tax=Alteromonadaceae TaxID=72275 RepID=UPI003D009640